MKYEVVADKIYLNDWRVEAINQSGDSFVTLFSGPDAEERAKEYAAWKLSADAPAKE